MLGGGSPSCMEIVFGRAAVCKAPQKLGKSHWRPHFTSSHLHPFTSCVAALGKGEGLVRYDANAVKDSWVRAKACVGNATNAGLWWQEFQWMPAHNMKAPKQPQEDTSQTKIDVTSKFPVGGHITCHFDKNRCYTAKRRKRYEMKA